MSTVRCPVKRGGLTRSCLCINTCPTCYQLRTYPCVTIPCCIVLKIESCFRYRVCVWLDTEHLTAQVRYLYKKYRVHYPTRNMTLPETCCKSIPILHSRNISWLVFAACGTLKILDTISNHIHQQVSYSFKLWVWKFLDFPLLPLWRTGSRRT